MIIYKRKKKQLVIPCGLGPVVCVDPGYELQTKTVDPSTAEITVEPDASYYGLYHVIVNPVTADIDPDLLASNIKRGVEILGVEGTFDGGPLQDKTVDSSTSGQVITPDGSNYGLGSVTVNPYVLDSKTVNPSTGQITVTSDADGLSSVTVNAAPLQSRTVDPSTEPLDIARTTSNWYGLNHVYINPVTAGIDSDIQAENIKRGVEILGVEGTFDGGTLQSKTVDASTASQTVTPDEGNYGLSSVTVNPYTVESKSDTISANGQFVYTPTGADALSSVTVDVSIKTAPYLQSKTVDSSTSSQSVTADSNYDGLSSVTVNPYVLDTKTVDPSVNIQTVTSDADGLSSVTVNAAVLQNRTVDPSTVQLDVQRTSNDYYGLRHVYINAVTSAIDPDIQAGNIKRGVEILGVEGTFDGGTLQSKTVDSSIVSQTLTPDGSNYGLSSVTVNPYTVEAKSQTITQNGQYTITPANADAISSVDISVNVADIPPVVQTKSETYIQNGDYQVTPDQGYDGISSIDISVNVQPALQSKIVDSSTSSQSVTADSNFDGLSSVTVNPYVLDTKTVDSSTVSQTITSDEDGLSSVTINPYVLDSKTVDPSTNQIIVNSSADGLSSVTVNAANLQSRTVDPSTVQVRHYPTAAGAIGLSSLAVRAVTSSIDSNIQAENIKDGVTILGVTGTFEGGPLQSKNIDSSTVSQTVTPDEGNYGLSSVTVNPYVLDTKTVDSSTVSQTITSSEDGLSSVTVNPYVLDTKTVDCSTGQQIITSDADGLSSVTVNAAKLQGRSYTPQRTDNTIYPNYSDGWIGFSKVTIYGVTAAVDQDIQPENIKRGVEILGVTGTFDGGPLQSKYVNPSTGSQTVTPDSSYYGLSSVTVGSIALGSRTINPSIGDQTINAEHYGFQGFSEVTVKGAPLQTKTLDSSTVMQTVFSDSSYWGITTVIVRPYILDEKTVDSSTSVQVVTSSEDGLSSVTVNPYTVESVTVNASTSEQTITPSNADAISSVTVNAATLQNRTVDASTAQIQVSRTSSSYYGLRTVTINAVTSSIDSNIQAGNIKDGVTILGVTGTYEGTPIPPDYDTIYNALIEI